MTGASPVDLSIVIVNYRSWDRLSAGLASLEPLLRGEAHTEVIVVDNASVDGVFQRFAASHPGARFIENDGNWGFADGCNRGAAEARGEFLLFFNPDALDPGGAIAAWLGEARAQPDAAIMTTRQVDESGRPQKTFDMFPSLLTLLGPVRALLRAAAPARYPDPRIERRSTFDVDWVSGAALLARGDVFRRLGGFCNGFWMYSEDVDLCRRARDAGHRVAVAGAITLIHAHGGASRANKTTRAITRSEVVISRHFYASRHFGAIHAAAYHAALVVTRFVPALVSRWRTAGLLARYYARVPVRGWRSARARP